MQKSIFTPALLVATLGYFVDVFDLLLFGIVRIASLVDLGVPQEALLTTGLHLINMQMLGMLLGGILWGVLGDKRGRVSVLFGSILLYSVANIANAGVGLLGSYSILAYGILRFAAGLGLAGELGAAVTLVSETMDAKSRGYGTAILASLGLSGGIFASLVGEYLPWQTAYLVGGGMGLALLTLRISLRESSLFTSMPAQKRRGDLRIFLRDGAKLRRYLRCILIGLPTWFTIGILITFSPELARALGIAEPISAAQAILYSYIGISIGDLLSGLLSQWFETRKNIIFFFILATACGIAIYLGFGSHLSARSFYALNIALGIATGYWAVFITCAAEQFGTNIRATVTTTAPNFIRGSVVILTSAFHFLSYYFGLIGSAAVVGASCIVIALIALQGLEETYGKNLDFLE